MFYLLHIDVGNYFEVYEKPEVDESVNTGGNEFIMTQNL